MSSRLAPGETLQDAGRRLIGREIAAIREALDLARRDHTQGVHQARKRFKRIRATLGLLRAANEDFFTVENARYRDLSRTFAPAREAAALVETVDRLAGEEPEAAEALAALRERLVMRVPADGDARLAVALDNAEAWCEAGVAAAADFSVSHDAPDDAHVVAVGVAEPLRRARKAIAQLRRYEVAEDFHDLRKAVKAHGAHLSLLADIWQPDGKDRRRAVEQLGEHLGELNDVHVLRHLTMSCPIPPGGLAATARLTRLLDRAGKKHARTSLAMARKLFEKKPRSVAADVVKAMKVAAARSADDERLASRLAAMA